MVKQENAALREQRRRLVEDPDTIEALARQELGLIRSGEILAVIRDVN
jgi:cell division protein FtsB